MVTSTPILDTASDAMSDAQRSAILDKYNETRKKRLRADGDAQYVEPANEADLQYLVADPWINPARPVPSVEEVLPDKACKALVLGAGPGGLVIAARLVHDAGFRPEDVCVVDSAGGAGGTWYWNRYPGLMCDVESYVYLPMLEETGYMPKHKYSYGGEIRTYCERLIKQFGFKALYQSVIVSMDWSDERSLWLTTLRQHRSGQEPTQVCIASEFVSIASGTLSHPKIPRWPGLRDYKGRMFHTARWRYDITGGSPDDWDLKNLQGKTVGFIGTGATAVQAVPHLAKWAKHLYVFQRTPSAVDVRGQRETDPEEWARMSSRPGWVVERHANMMANISEPPETRPETDMVDDGWTHFHAYPALVGGPVGANMSDMAKIVETYTTTDFGRSERIRARVDQLVDNKQVAAQLKAYYPGFCKRPCFHDDYLSTFDQPNVTLVDTDGKGVDALTADGVMHQGTEYPVDILICGTGYRSPVQHAHARANMNINGRNGASLDHKFQENLATLHGVLTRDFPNLLLCGPTQAAASPSITYIFEEQARHIAHILREAKKQAGESRFTVEPTAEAEQAWATRLLMLAHNFVAIQGCLPSYFNREGQAMTMEEGMKAAKGGIWGKGCNDWVRTIRQWRKESNMEGIEVQRVS